MTRRFTLLTLWVCLFTAAAAASITAQQPAQSKPVPILWKDPGNIAALDLFWGSGGSDKAPKPPFTFVSEDTGGTNPKVIVTDSQGRKWSVKFRSSESKDEVHSEVAASRLLWALGFMVEDDYFIDSGTIEGVQRLSRAKSAISEDGRFTNARFELRDKEFKHLERTWALNKNPFQNTRELSGLKILLVLLSDWDTKTSNTDVLQTKGTQGTIEDRYLITDLGATFGRMGIDTFSARSRWNLEDYRKGPFIDKVSNGKLKLHYSGVSVIDEVPLEHARWFAGLACQLTEAQVRRAFEAAGASEEEIAGYSARVLEKIADLQRAVGTPVTAPTLTIESKPTVIESH